MAQKLLDSGPMGKIVKTYLMLIGVAVRRETIRYGDIARKVGVANQDVGRSCLVPVYQFCQRNQFPDLTTIVVRGDTGQPAEGHGRGDDAFYRERERVYDFPWMDYAPPTIADSESARAS